MKVFRKELKNIVKEVVNKHLEKYNIVNCGIYFDFNDNFEDDILIDFNHESLKCELDVWETYFDLKICFSYSEKKLVIETLNVHSTVTLEGNAYDCDKQYFEYIEECEKHVRIKSLLREINKALESIQFLDGVLLDFLYYDVEHKRLLLYDYPIRKYLEVRRGVIDDVYVLEFRKRERDIFHELKGLRVSFSKRDLEQLNKEDYQKYLNDFLTYYKFKNVENEHDGWLECKELPPKEWDKLVEEVRIHGGELSYE